MGDIGTHADISRFAVAQVRRVVPDTDIPAADYAYLELGNFLTDVSQFQDPTSYHKARRRAKKETPFLAPVFGSGKWLPDVFGTKKPEQRHGALPQMLRLFMSAATHLVFDDDALPKLGQVVAAVTAGGPSILQSHGIPGADVDAVLASNFTQYYPHEHLDATPLPAEAYPTHRTRPDFAVGQRNLIQYLEDDLLFLSEELSKLELTWLVNRQVGVTAKQRQQFLVQLGHLLHAVEDYFFHSNLAEMHVWKAAKAAQPPGTDRSALLGATLARTKLDPTSVPLRRLLNRRLRYPVYDAPDQLSLSHSTDATDLVYTGGFGSTDVWHTLGGALEAMEEQLDRLDQAASQVAPAQWTDPRSTHLVLFKMLISQQARQQMVADESVEKMWKLHLKQLKAGDYDTAIDSFAASGVICSHAIASLREAMALDAAISKRHSGTFVDFPGPGGILIMMMDEMEKERQNSAKAQAKLDAKPASVDDIASDNRASAENIGTHTLMSKDATSKEPLRPEAVALAKHASAGIARRFLRRVTTGGSVNEGVDWDAELRFYVRGVVPNGWESELLTAVAGPAFNQPDLDTLNDQPNFPLLGPDRDAARLADRRTRSTTGRLEMYYRNMES